MHDPNWMSSTPLRTDPLPPPGPPLLVLRGVGHVYDRRGPWATRALEGIDLTVHRGEGLLVIGGNGSGKSTLAWIMAGLTKPSEGTCELSGKATSSSVGTVPGAVAVVRAPSGGSTVTVPVAWSPFAVRTWNANWSAAGMVPSGR